MAFWSKKNRVSREQMGEVLCYTAITRTKAFLRNDSLIEELGLANADRNYLFQELMIVNMFVLIESFQQTVNLSDYATEEILDKMHSCYFKELVDKFNLTAVEIKELYDYSWQRYDEYRTVIESNKSSNWLQEFAKRMLNNLHNKITHDAVAVMNVALELTSLYKFTPDLLRQYSIV